MNNIYSNLENKPRSEKPEALKTEFAGFAEFARPQIEKNNVIASTDYADNLPVINQWVYDHLPDLLQTGCSVFKTERQRDIFLTGAITILSGCLNTITGEYDGRIVSNNLYCFVTAPPASDKGVLTFAKQLGNVIHTRLLAENESALKKYSSELSQYKMACKVSNDFSMNSSAPIEPKHKMLYIPANSSSAAMMRHIQHNDGCGIICETEADTLVNTLKQEWGNFDDLLRKAFHQEPFSYSRKKDNEFVEVERPKLAVVLSGTPGQVSRLLVSNENGLVSRFIFYYSNTVSKWHSVSPKNNINLDTYFQSLSERVYHIYENIKNKSIEFVIPDDLWDIIDSNFETKLSKVDNDLRSTVVRLGIIVFKIAMVFTILRHEKQLPEDNRIICKPYDLRIALLLAEVYQKHADQVYSSLLVPKQKSVDSMASRFYASLPEGNEFQRGDAVAIASKLSFSTRKADEYLKQFVFEGSLAQVKFGTYLKM